MLAPIGEGRGLVAAALGPSDRALNSEACLRMLVEAHQRPPGLYHVPNLPSGVKNAAVIVPDGSKHVARWQGEVRAQP